jgi:hypothetical protein
VERSREAEEMVMRFHADLRKITEWWPSAADGPIKLAEPSAALLGSLPDLERVKVYG